MTIEYNSLVDKDDHKKKHTENNHCAIFFLNGVECGDGEGGCAYGSNGPNKSWVSQKNNIFRRKLVYPCEPTIPNLVVFLP